MRGEARRPYFLRAVDRVILRPHVIELERALDDPLLELLLVVAIEVLAVLRDRPDRQDRIAENLELLGDSVIEAGIGVVRPAEHQDRDAIFGFDRLEDRASLGLDVLVEDRLGLPRFSA